MRWSCSTNVRVTDRQIGSAGIRRRLGGLLCAGVVLTTVAITRGEEGTSDSEATPEAKLEAKLGNNPYRAIVARNAFRLKDPVPPPPVVTAPVTPEPPKLDVKLAGLAEIAGVRYAYLVVPDASRPGQFEYPALTDDPARGGGVRHKSGIEVQAINLKAQTVRLLNGGIEATLNLKEDGMKNVASATPVKPGAAPANQPGQVRLRQPNTVVGAGAVAAPATAASSGEPLIFSRDPNRASGGAGGNAVAGNTAWNANNAGGSVLPSPTSPVTLPTRPVRTEVAVPDGAGNAPVIPVQQQLEVLLQQRQAAEALGVPLPPIPGMPTPPPPEPQQ